MEHAPTIPAVGSAFLNRSAELERLARALDALRAGRPRWVALIGQRKIGKTSLLKEWVRQTPALLVGWACFDLFRESPGPGFLRRWACRLLDAALGGELPGSIEHTLGEPARFRAMLLGAPSYRKLPIDVQSWLLGVPVAHPTPDWVPLALELPELLAVATGLPLIVVIDEFQELLGSRILPGEVDVTRRFRGAWQHHQRVTYVIAGSAQHTIEQLVTHKKSAFFDHFDLIRLGPLPPAEAEELLRRVAGRDIAPRAVEAALRVLGGHPFCLHALGDALYGGPGVVSLQEVKGAVQSLLFSSDGRLSLHFEQSYRELVGQASTAAAVVEQLAAGPVRLSEVARATGMATGAVATALTRLGEAVIRGKDGAYNLADPVLALWLRWRLPGGTAVPMRALGDEAELRVAEAMAARGFELVYQSRGSRGSFDLLAFRKGRLLAVQVKRRASAARVERAELERIRADALTMGVPWVLAAVDPRGGIRFLEPSRAGERGQFRGEIENLPMWLDALPKQELPQEIAALLRGRMES